MTPTRTYNLDRLATIIIMHILFAFGSLQLFVELLFNVHMYDSDVSLQKSVMQYSRLLESMFVCLTVTRVHSVSPYRSPIQQGRYFDLTASFRVPSAGQNCGPHQLQASRLILFHQK